MLTSPPTPNSPRPAFAHAVFYVLLGSASYGLLSTVVKLAYAKGYTTAEVVLSQFFWGVVGLGLLNLITAQPPSKPTRQDKRQLMLAGLPLGLTGLLYYFCVRELSAGIAVVLLMQSVWMGVFIEAFLKRRWPELSKMGGVVLVLIGTFFATNLWNESSAVTGTGLALGLLSALSYAWTLFASSRVAAHLSPLQRGQYMVRGGALLVAMAFGVLGLLQQPHGPFQFQIFASYGLFLALFGTIIPPLMLNRGFPVVGVGLGSILSSVELPFAMMMAYLLLGEKINLTQGLGVALILGAIVLINAPFLRRPRRP